MRCFCLQVYCCTTCQPLQLNIAAGAAAAAAEVGSSKKAVGRKRASSKSSKQEGASEAAAAAAVAVTAVGADAAAKQLLSPARLKSMATAQVAKVGVLVRLCVASDA